MDAMLPGILRWETAHIQNRHGGADNNVILVDNVTLVDGDSYMQTLRVDIDIQCCDSQFFVSCHERQVFLLQSHELLLVSLHILPGRTCASQDLLQQHPRPLAACR